MTGIAAILGPDEKSVASELDTILGAMENRGQIRNSATIKSRENVLAIGSCSHAGEESLTARPEQISAVVDGEIPSSLELEEIGGLVDEESLFETMKYAGAFSILAISTGRLLAVRDVLGQKPLYFGSDSRRMAAFSSLKTALMNIGIANPKPVPPGQLVATSKKGLSVLRDRRLTKPREVRVSERDAVTTLRELLVESLNETPQDLALAFSGGLDSTIVAQAAKENDLQPELITVGMKGQPELRHASSVSKRLKLDVTVRELAESDVLDSLPDVVQTIESTDPVLVGVSIPLFFVCEIAQEMGMECLLAGQLSDELFAGYGRFDRLAGKKNLRSAREEVWRSVLAASDNDFEPGDKLAVSHHLELRCPFAFLPLVEYALRIPISLKLRAVGRKIVRKYILRRVASDWKLPDTVVSRPKKAVQYSSGVQKVLLKEAKRRRMTLGGFLASIGSNC